MSEEKPSWEWRQEVEALKVELERTKSGMASEYEMDMNDQIRKRKAVEQQLAERNTRIAELEKDQHKPTVTYLMNLCTQMQQQAKQCFDQWFVVQQRVEELERQFATAQQAVTDMREDRDRTYEAMLDTQQQIDEQARKAQP